MAFVRLFQTSTNSARAFGSAWLCLAVCAAASGRLVRADGHADRELVQRIVDDSRGRLSIPQEVRVSIVPKNALMVSVERQPGQDVSFLLSFEESFLEQLTEDEIRTVVAHELGHVWIFTHHPYLQTEQLANEIATRLVARESLEPVYAKVRKHAGESRDLARNLGDKPADLP
jgi:hypothetical protein